MLETVKDILNRIPWKFGYIVVVLLLARDVYTFFNDETTSTFLMKKKDIQTSLELNDKIRKKIEDAKVFFQNLERKKDELRKLAVELSEMKNTLSEDIDIANFIKMVTTESKKVGLKVLSLRPSGEKSEEFYVQQEFELKFRSIYAQLVILMDRLSSANKIIRIDEYFLEPVKQDSSGRFVELNGTMKIKTYKYNSSKADEVAKSGGSE